MPEGPSLVILKDLTQESVGRKILHVEGNSKIDLARIQGQYIKSIRTWGKHFLIELSGFSIRIHLLIFGSYRINERRESPARLSLKCSDHTELNFYACSVKFIEAELDDVYDWSSDVMSGQWNPAAARKKLRSSPLKLACDALLDQDIFAGVGNIIRNEVLFRIRVHPLSEIGALPAVKLRSLVDEARQYSFQFLEWEKAFVLRQHWLAHNKRTCPRCNIPYTRAHLGATHRRSFFCEKCQKKYLLQI